VKRAGSKIYPSKSCPVTLFFQRELPLSVCITSQWCHKIWIHQFNLFMKSWSNHLPASPWAHGGAFHSQSKRPPSPCACLDVLTGPKERGQATLNWKLINCEST
jgi:hypothetical protein